MSKYQSTNPDSPYAGANIAMTIETGKTRKPAILRYWLESCGYTVERHDMGDIVFRNASNGDRIRMAYLCRDTWTLSDESHWGLKVARWAIDELVLSGVKVKRGIKREFQPATRQVWDEAQVYLSSSAHPPSWWCENRIPQRSALRHPHHAGNPAGVRML